MGISHRDALHVYCAYDVELRAFAMMPSSFLKMCSLKKKKKKKNRMFRFLDEIILISYIGGCLFNSVTYIERTLCVRQCIVF